MSSCLTGGGGRTYALDLEIVKSPSTTSTWTSHTHTHTSSSSSSSTLSESSNSPLAISTRKARTPRKRPNQTYNEAAALLSTAYPNIFSTKNLTKPRKFTKQHDYYSVFDEPSELLPFRVIDSSGFLLRQPILEEKPISQFQSSKVSKPGEVDFHFHGHGHGDSTELCCDGNGNGYEYEEDFDAGSILDEEIEEGIDSIMGNLSVDSSAEVADEWKGPRRALAMNNCWNSNVNLGFGGKFNMRALRHVEEQEANWWSCPNPIVDVRQISPRFHNAVSPSSVLTEEKKKKKKKKKKKLENLEDPVAVDTEISDSVPKPNSGLLLKLNFDEVLNAWSDRGCPFSDQIPPGSEFPGNDVYARAAQIDLFSESGGLREASVLRYKEKRRTRLFSKKIRYQVRKVNADRRPRMKGRFVRRPNSSANGQR
ncbi:protein CHLOROPLAST IMPORT APPARATUS 2 [Quercus lobata]|uniref:CCT domain-containing protein n=1 Tax=Quercus lobata TaxID=97700 RepID=A0A7N2KX36_QUELO|nr:protein CHLOROPLAST IMPORT APPARATUS 2 [Quercus lobata]